MGFYGDKVLPRLIDVVLGRPFEQVRERAVQGLSGDVLELGFGSGRNVPHLPGGVTRLLAVDPAVAARRLAEPRIARRGLPVEFVGLDGEHLPLPDGSIEHALSTWTLCTIPDADRALAEVARVLKPGGTLHFVEHGRSPHRRVAGWQRRLNRPWGALAGGCRLDRPIDTMIGAAGLTLVELRAERLFRPEVFGYIYRGVAAKE